jgi:hypothetical protein
LNAAGYYEDGNDQNAITNDGYVKRKNLFATSNSVQFISKLDADLFNSELYLVNNVEIDIEIIPNDNSTLILSPDAANNTVYRLEITSCKLYVKMVELMDGLALDISKKLEQHPARYALRKTVIKSLFITENRTEYNANLFSEQVPRRVVLGLVENTAYVGSQRQSPFVFKPFNLREITLTANGFNYPASPYNLDFTSNKFVRAFHDMNEGVGMVGSTESNGISLEKYKDGWTIYVFNLTNSQEENQCFDLIKNGTTSINIKFTQGVPAGGIVLIAMGEIDSLLMIDKNRTISSDATI